MTGSRVFLFDIDNTLLYSGGAGVYAMNRILEEMFGVAEGFRRIEFSGRTDLYILQQGLAALGIDTDPETHLRAFTAAYYALLPQAMTQHQGRLMPGFPALLSALRNAGARLGLATGNFSEAARIKLDHFGLGDYFEGGGFGEESVVRSQVVATAIRNVANGARPEDVFVIGDTPHDITAALDNGVVAVGVATGTYTIDALRDSGAHLLFQDFADWEKAAAELLGDP